MTLALDYAPGMSLTDPYLFTIATKVNPSYRVTASGTLSLLGATQIADNHYINGIRTTLFECSTTNSMFQSQAWATSPWSNNVVTATNNSAAAPDGTLTATKLLPNNTGASNNPYVTGGATAGSIAITPDENLAASFFVKANGYGAVVLRCSDAASTNGFQVSFDLVNGALGSLGNGFGAGTLTGSTFIALANGWYWVSLWGNLSNSLSGVHPTACQVFCYVYDTITHANAQTAYIANGTSSVLGWGAQVERWGTAVKGSSTSYVPTTTAALGRLANSVSMAWPWQTMPFWGYAKFIDLGWSARADFEPLLEFTDISTATPRIALFPGSGSGGANPSHRFNYVSSVGVLQSAAILSPGANYGDTVELFFRFLSDGSLQLQRSINGAAVTSNTNGGATPDFFDIASRVSTGPLFYMNSSATVGLIRMKVGMNPGVVTTLAQGAAA